MEQKIKTYIETTEGFFYPSFLVDCEEKEVVSEVTECVIGWCSRNGLSYDNDVLEWEIEE